MVGYPSLCKTLSKALNENESWGVELSDHSDVVLRGVPFDILGARGGGGMGILFFDLARFPLPFSSGKAEFHQKFSIFGPWIIFLVMDTPDYQIAY